MTAAEYIAQWLADHGVRHVFELSGGMIVSLLDAIYRQGRIAIVSMHHEQGAGFAAEGVGRMTGVPGVAMATSGPGATNLLTAVGSCYFDSTPALFITGQVNRSEQKGERAIRQLGFQETDIVQMVRPITKAAWKLASIEQLPEVLAEAFSTAQSGRPGPTLLDIPMDLQRAEVLSGSESVSVPAFTSSARTDKTATAADNDFLTEFQDALSRAQRPLILAGGGIRSGQATSAFRQFVEVMGVPVVHSLMGVDLLPHTHPHRVGMIGTYGNRWANMALGNCDLLLVVGSRLDVRQTGSDTGAFSRHKQIFHIDCQPGEMNNRVVGCLTLTAEAGHFLTVSVAHFTQGSRRSRDHSAWIQQIVRHREQWPDSAELANVPGINPNRFMHALSAASQQSAAYVVDVGQHQMWAAQSLRLHSDQRFLTSGGMGSMGFALPASIGAAFGVSPRPVVMIAGDGGFQCNIQELQTVRRNRLPIKLVILDNGCHGMVRQFQESYFDSRYQSTLWGYSAPDFARVAQAYDIDAYTLSSPEDVKDALTWLWAQPLEPRLLHVKIDTYANAYPKIAFGRPITEMEPLAKPVEMEGT
jgi:acetolactate synthase-1/2/3 large subunit